MFGFLIINSVVPTILSMCVSFVILGEGQFCLFYMFTCSTSLQQERPKSAVFPAEVKSKMSIEEQNERIRRNQSSSVRDRRRSVNLSTGQSPANYKVV